MKGCWGLWFRLCGFRVAEFRVVGVLGSLWAFS